MEVYLCLIRHCSDGGPNLISASAEHNEMSHRHAFVAALLFSIMSYATHATLFAPQPAACVATVHVDSQESFGHAQAVHSVYTSRVIAAEGCGEIHPGDQLYFAAPGGLHGAYETRVNGISVEIGQESIVQLSSSATSLGIPFLLKAASSSAEIDPSAPAFMCFRVPPSGPFLFWRHRTVIMNPSLARGSKAPSRDLVQAMHWAAEQWSSVGGSDFRFEIGEPTTQRWVGFDWSQRGPNYNIVTVREPSSNDFYSQWAHHANAIAMTSITFIHLTGEIVDADIEINRHMYEFADCHNYPSSCGRRFDLKSTLTHEFGHVLGLDHPNKALHRAAATTMYADTTTGEISKSWLSDDDATGLRFLYPEGGHSRDCFLDTRPQPVKMKVSQYTGCAQTQGSQIWPLTIVLAMLLMAIRRAKKLKA
jgi:hypothetical protein